MDQSQTVDRTQFQEQFNVAEAVMGKLDIYVTMLIEWQKAKNLVAPSTLTSIWQRHIADCYQLIRLRINPDVKSHWLDLGSGAGLPGLITAIAQQDLTGDGSVTMVEANGRKCAFLRAVSRETKIDVTIVNQRIEKLDLNALAHAPDIITARALAALDSLCHLSHQLMSEKTVAMFQKGQDFVSEIDLATKSWDFTVVKHKSLIDEQAIILAISNLNKKADLK